MHLKIQSTKENQLLQRNEIMAAVEFDGATPSNAEVAASLASQLGVAVGAERLGGVCECVWVLYVSMGCVRLFGAACARVRVRARVQQT